MSEREATIDECCDDDVLDDVNRVLAPHDMRFDLKGQDSRGRLVFRLNGGIAAAAMEAARAGSERLHREISEHPCGWMGRCGSCANWKTEPIDNIGNYGTEDDLLGPDDVGECLAIRAKEDGVGTVRTARRHLACSTTVRPTIFTHAAFGCVKWEAGE